MKALKFLIDGLIDRKCINKNLVLAVFLFILFFNQTFNYFTVFISAQGAGDAYFTPIEYNSVIYQGNQDLWILNTYNGECEHKRFFFKFYEDSRLFFDEYTETGPFQLEVGKGVWRSYKLHAGPGPRYREIKIEPYSVDSQGTPHLQDTEYFEIIALESTVSLSGLILDETNNPLDGVTISVFYKHDKLEREWKHITDSESGLNGFFNISIPKTKYVRLYAFDPHLNYVPEVFEAELQWESLELTIRLHKSARIIFDGDLLFVNSTNIWDAKGLFFYANTSLKNAVKSYPDPVLPLNQREIIVPSGYPLTIQVRNGEGGSFEISDLPPLEDNEVVHIDFRKYTSIINRDLTSMIVKRVKQLLNSLQAAGFYLTMERRELSRAEELLRSAEEKLISDRYEDFYIGIRQSYLTVQKLSEKMETILSEAEGSTAILPPFIAFSAFTLASFLFEDRRRKIISTIFLFSIFLSILYIINPGPRVVSLQHLTIFTLLSFSLMMLIFLIIELRGFRKSSKGKESSMNVFREILSMAKRNLKRRKLRLTLLFIGQLITVMAFVALTSFTIDYGLITSKFSAEGLNEGSFMIEGLRRPETYTLSDVPRVILKIAPITPLLQSDVDWVRNREIVDYAAPKMLNFPVENPIGILKGAKQKPIFGVIGISPEIEGKVSGLDGLITEGRFLDTDARDEVLLSERAASELNVKVGEEVTWIPSGPTWTPFKYRLVGLVNDEALSNLKELNGQHFLPEKLVRKIIGENAILIEPILCQSDEVLITTIDVRSEISNVAVVISRVAGTLRNDFEPSTFAKDIVWTRDFQIWIYTLGNVVSWKVGEYPNIGGAGVIVPLTLVSLNIALTYFTSVYERRGETFILSSVGMNPTYVTLLYIAESIIIGLIGSTIGYLSGMGLYRILDLFRIELEVTQKISASWSFISLIFGVVAVTVGSVIPALKASLVATPSLLRRWSKEERAKIEENRNLFTLPIKLQRAEIESFINYLIKKLTLRKAIDSDIRNIRTYTQTLKDTDTKILEFTRLTGQTSLDRHFIKCRMEFKKEKNRNLYTVELSLNALGVDAEKKIYETVDILRKLVLEWEG